MDFILFHFGNVNLNLVKTVLDKVKIKKYNIDKLMMCYLIVS
jgi:hypothetical protein